MSVKLPEKAVGFRGQSPKKGELCVGCEHIGDSSMCNFYRSPHGSLLSVTDLNTGKIVHPTWALICKNCVSESAGDLSKLKLRKVFAWQRDGVNTEDPRDPLKRYDA